MKVSKILTRAGITVAVLAVIATVFIALIYKVLFVPQFTSAYSGEELQNNPERYGSEEIKRQAKEDEQWMRAQETVTYTLDTADGVTLAAEYMPSQGKEKGIVVLVHGHKSSPQRDFGRYVQFYLENGYSVLMPYLRGHGKSGGDTLTFGILERRDIYDWVNFLNDVFGMDHDIWIHGVSMGCAVALMGSGYGYPFNVRGIIADCGYTAPKEIVKHFIQIKKIPCAPLFVALADFCVKTRTGVSLGDYTTLDAMKVNQTPVLFIHGTSDNYVPLYMTIANFETCKAPKQLYLCEGGKHVMSAYTNRELYFKNIEDFMQQHSLVW